MSCFQKTNDGNKAMIICTIAKQFKQLTLACKIKKNKIHYTFVPLENFRKRIQIFSLTQNKNHMAFLSLISHEFPLFDMIDWAKIVLASWIAQFMWNTKYLP